MDANNILWACTDEEQGYPPGSFYSRVLTAIFDLPVAVQDQLYLLLNIFNKADYKNMAELEELFPGAKGVLQAYYLGEMNGLETQNRLWVQLRAMPFLLSQLTGLRSIVYETSHCLAGRGPDGKKATHDDDCPESNTNESI